MSKRRKFSAEFKRASTKAQCTGIWQVLPPYPVQAWHPAFYKPITDTGVRRCIVALPPSWPYLFLLTGIIQSLLKTYHRRWSQAARISTVA